MCTLISSGSKREDFSVSRYHSRLQFRASFPGPGRISPHLGELAGIYVVVLLSVIIKQVSNPVAEDAYRVGHGFSEVACEPYCGGLSDYQLASDLPISFYTIGGMRVNFLLPMVSPREYVGSIHIEN